MKEKILRNTLFSGGSSVISGIIGFFLLPFMIAKVGVVEFGLVGICTIFMMSGYASLLEMGFQSSIAKYTAQFNAVGQSEKISQLITSTLLIFVLIGAAMMILGLALSNIFVTSVFPIPKLFHASLNTAFILIFASYLFQFPNVVLSGFLEGVQRYDILKGAQTLASILNALMIVAFLSMGYGYLFIIVSYLISLLVQFIIILVFVFKEFQFLSIGPKNISMEVVREIWPMTKLLFIGKGSELIYNTTPRVLVGLFLTPAYMTSFDVVIRAPRFIKVVLGFINSAVMPAASELYAEKRLDTIRKLFQRGIRYQFFIALPVVSGVMFFAEDLMKVWIGEDFIFLGVLLQFVLVWNLITPLINYGGSIMVGMNKNLKQMTILAVTKTILSVFISLGLVMAMGLKGVFAGFVISAALVLPPYLYIYFKELSIGYLSLFKEILLITVPVIVPFTIMYALDGLLVINSLTMLFVKGLLWCVTYWVALYFMVFKPEDKEIVRLIIFNLKTRRTAQS